MYGRNGHAVIALRTTRNNGEKNVAAMVKGLDLGKLEVPSAPAEEHDDCCPFCGRPFNRRDPGQVLEHYKRQLAARAPPAVDLTSEEDKLPGLRKIIPFDPSRRREKP